MSRTRATLALIGVTALVGCVSTYDSTVLMSASRATQAPPADSTRLAVMTANLKRCRRTGQLQAMARRLSVDETPDFILCQEVIFGETADAHGDTAHILADELGCDSRGTRRDDGGEGVAIISRHPFAHYDELPLEAQTSSFIFGFPRVSIMGEFVVPDVGRVRVVNVHLAHWPFEDHTRWQQLNETLEWIAARQRRAPADVTILGGDFNADRGSSSLSLVERWSSFGALQYRDFNTSRPTRGLRRVDHLFVAGAGCEVAMMGEDLVGSPSDHHAVMQVYAVSPATR